MAWVIYCECGVAIKGVTDDEIVRNAQDHARTAHAMTITPEQALALAEPE